MTKHFDGYFGLDGMTCGILDWTSDNLPSVMKAFQLRDGRKYNELFAHLNIPMRDGCIDPNWVCSKNRNAELICNASFHDAFSESLQTEAFQKAQMDVALRAYEKRLAQFSKLGLETEYGNTAMAVIANNLRRTAACKPETWKKTCVDQPDEAKLVDCMLEQYAKNSCRGSLYGSRERKRAIEQVFAGAKSGENIHPTPEAVASCSTFWGGGH